MPGRTTECVVPVYTLADDDLAENSPLTRFLASESSVQYAATAKVPLIHCFEKLARKTLLWNSAFKLWLAALSRQ